MLILGLLACRGAAETDLGETDGADTDVVDTDTGPEPVRVVSLTTRDGVALEADEYPAEGAPAVVLLHMVPPSWDRESWPAEFVDRLRADGWAVLAVDRRGAGGSGGEAEDAYTGEFGRYDVEACVLHLQAAGAPQIAVIGASNGTTSMVDYAAWAGGEGLPVPVALGFVTGGEYTENNTTMGDLPAIPSIFTFSTEERDWSILQQEASAEGRTFLEYPEGDHGTKMFEAAPEVTEDIAVFLSGIRP